MMTIIVLTQQMVTVRMMIAIMTNRGDNDDKPVPDLFAATCFGVVVFVYGSNMCLVLSRSSQRCHNKHAPSLASG